MNKTYTILRIGYTILIDKKNSLFFFEINLDTIINRDVQVL